MKYFHYDILRALTAVQRDEGDGKAITVKT
jgi:hypothetical protein